MPNNNQQKIDAYFNAFQARIQQAIDQVPKIGGVEVVNFALDNFKAQAWNGTPWEKRKHKPKRGAGNQQLLVQSGRLRKSIRVTRTTATSVTVGSDVPYARAHNDGALISRNAHSETFVRNRYSTGKRKGLFKKGTSSGQGFTFKASSFNMPQRQFLGGSPELKQRLQKVIKEHLLTEIRK